MLNDRKNRQAGFTLVELIIGVVILGILASVALPSFQSWTQNSKVRNAAESITNGIQRARAAAVARNAVVEFNLSADSSWNVKIAGVGGEVIESRSSSEGSKGVTLTAVAEDSSDATTITYNNFGGVTANVDGNPPLAQIDLEVVGASRNLRVVISTGGIARMCDTSAESGSLSAC